MDFSILTLPSLPESGYPKEEKHREACCDAPMAQPSPEITLQVDATAKDVSEKTTAKEECTDEGARGKTAEHSTIQVGSDSVETSARQDTTTDAQSSAPPPRPSLVPLGSTHGHSSLSTPAAPHPKRFSAVNINKKFLEKNTASGSSTTTSSTSSNMKVGNSAARPTIQQTSSHPKLVTAKLTAGPTVSSTPAGWSRSPSVAPSPAPATSSPSSTSPLPSSTPATQASATASQSPHIIKAMQQQPRTAATQLNSSKESSKPVWGNVKPPTVVPLRADVQANDFPTAAEVANVAMRKQVKPDDVKLTTKPPSKQLRSEEADTFRGVHLDPNAHHWDEMEEDDDNFLDGVIEFGDGRQYKVNTSELQQPVASSETQGAPSQGDVKLDPVSKEERFVDDFDRSWPRSKGSPSPSSKELSSNNARSVSPKPLPGQSPREYPRVLFNERSNRLEPYSHSSHRQVQPFGQKRPSINEGVSDSLRGTRDGSHNIQVLRKGTGSDYPRSRRFSASSGGGYPPPNGFAGAHREGRRDAPPTSPRLPRDQPFPLSEGTFNDRPRRTSMGPPPLPASTSQRGHNRQLPPHLSPETAPRRLSSRDSQLLSPLDTPRSPSFTSTFSPQSPAISHASLSPHKTPYASLPGSAIDLEEIRKDVMHSAAERAKARRQMEEEDREAQKERARRKATELEERIKTEKANQEDAPKLPSETEVDAILEAAVENVECPASLKSQDNTSTISHAPRRPSIPSRPPITTPSSTPHVESWRRASPKQIQGRLPVSDPFSASGPSAVEQVASIADTASDLEVVDFTEMGRFVGVSEPSETHSEVSQAGETVGVLTKPPRPSASDFFEDSSGQPDPSVSAAKSADFGAWRKKVEVPNEAKNGTVSTPRKESYSEASVPEESTTKEPLSHLVTHGQTVHVPVHASPKPAHRPQFKEAPMSALDDTMSRIKGALVGMQACDTPVTSPGQGFQSKKATYHTSHTPLRQSTGRWVPPAIRVRDSDDSPGLQEMFPVTILDRPTTPSLEVLVQLPTLSRPLEFVHKKQLFAFNRPPLPARLDILTFEPPVPEMKRTWLLNDVLFRSISATFKPNFKYRVVIPKHRGLRPANSAKPNIAGAFGRPNIADGVSSWRKPMPPVSPLLKHDEAILETSLNTTTRSPPPEGKASENTIASIPRPSETSSSKSENIPPRTRQPKMPEGSVVAFMRDSRIDFVEGSPRPLVNFIVGSELDDSWCQTPTVAEPGVTTTSRVVHSPLVSKTELKHEPPKPLSNGSLLSPAGSGKEQMPPPVVDGKTSNDPVADGVATPPNHQSPWARSSLSLPVKDSPSRAPDPEHLKAVWSQPSNKLDVKPVNSLKGIADDLTPLPFVLPDVKSSEGTTPSPSLPSAPSRMSIHEVTRAFQQVPTSAANQPSRDKAQISPPTTNAPVARPAPANSTAAYPYPAPQNNLRPMYAQYPSPMLTHSPAPVMYSPVQNRVSNGHPPMYNTWVPAQSPMMRSMSQSYPTMVPYAPTGFNQPAGTNLMPLAPQTQGAGRPVGMAVISPVLSPVQPHPYGGSPVLMHTTQNHGYLPMPPDRVQPLRTDNGHMPQHPLSSSHSHPSTHAGFNPGPSSPFTRPW